MVASFAGIQNRARHSMRTVAVKSQPSVPTSGIVRNSSPRRRSPNTRVQRRSRRSAKAPARGPSSTAGASRRMKTPAIAKFSAVYEPPARFFASAAGASGGFLGGRGGGGQAEPAPEARPAEGQPEPAEREDPQHGGDVVLGRV